MSDNNPTVRLDPRLTERLEAKKQKLDLLRPLPASVVRQLEGDLRVFLTFHSNAIEGNTLSLRETQMVIEHGLTVGGKTLREHLEAANHARAFDYLTSVVAGKHDLIVNPEIILELHRLVMQGVDDETAGKLRTRQVYIRGASVTPPPASQVPGLLQQWLEWLEGRGRDYPPVVRFGLAHHQFEYIHPFTDGNGRTGRLLLNLQLMREGYPPALLLQEWRMGYLQGLDAANNGNFTPLINLIGRAVERGLDLYLEVADNNQELFYKSLSELAREMGLSVEYLGLLARQGKLEAVKRGKRWYSTSAAVEKYQREVQNKRFPLGRPKHEK